MSIKRLVAQISDAFDVRGWRDPGSDALALARALSERHPEPESVATSRFLALNHLTRSQYANFIKNLNVTVESKTTQSSAGESRSSALEGLDALIAIDDIDTFGEVSTVTPLDVVAAVPDLGILEQELKRAIVRIVGEPYIDGDWGGELSDQFTANVVFAGHRRRTSFLLKSTRGAPRKLRPSGLGKNADQIGRLLRQESQLFIVAHTGEIDESVYEQLASGIRGLRYEGGGAVGSVWDGTDCARLLTAYGLLDLSTGQLHDSIRE